MLSHDYLLMQSELCLRLSRSQTDRVLAQRLLSLAADYKQRAEETIEPPKNEVDVGIHNGV